MSKVQVLQPGLAVVLGFGNVGLAYGRGQVMAVDTGWRARGADAVRAMRQLTREPVALIIYTHGHIDHVLGTDAFLQDALMHGHQRPTIWAHTLVPVRQQAYVKLSGWTANVNSLQFGIPVSAERLRRGEGFIPPDFTYEKAAEVTLAGELVQLHHVRAETDDATWIWMPERRAAFVGDLLVNSMPNAGNPTKRQRYTLEWAQALDSVRAKRPEMVLPGHGPAYSGRLATEVLAGTAAALRHIHDTVLMRLNRGDWPVDIVEQEILLPAYLANKPWLEEVYGCVPFIVRDVLRNYAGWWNGQPSHLLPPAREAHGRDVVQLCGRGPLLARVRVLLGTGEIRRAVALAELAANALPHDPEVTALYAQSLRLLAREQTSSITRNLLRGSAARASRPPRWGGAAYLRPGLRRALS